MAMDDAATPEIFQLEGCEFRDTSCHRKVTNYYQRIRHNKIVKCTNKEQVLRSDVLPTKHKVIAPNESVSESDLRDFYAEIKTKPVIRYLLIQVHPNVGYYAGKLRSYKKYDREIVVFREHGIDGDDGLDIDEIESEDNFDSDISSVYDAPKEFRVQLGDLMKNRNSSLPRRRKRSKWEVIDDVEDDFEIVNMNDIVNAEEATTDKNARYSDDKTTVANQNGSSCCTKCGERFHFPMCCSDYAIWAVKLDQQLKLNTAINNPLPTKKCECGTYLCNRSNRDKFDFQCRKCQTTYSWQSGITKATGNFVLGRTHFHLRCKCSNFLIFENENGTTCKVCNMFWERIYNNQFHGSRRTCVPKFKTDNVIANFYGRHATWAHDELFNRNVPFSIPKECGLDAEQTKMLLYWRLKALYLIEFGFAWLYMSRHREAKNFKSSKVMLMKLFEKLIEVYTALERKKRLQNDDVVKLKSFVDDVCKKVVKNM
uniref:SWIM-type domain-containing protein n=1 Tax=Panagrellus redivivus TaxID=6233 RepID=A0A7E4V8I3_PANRE